MFDKSMVRQPRGAVKINGVAVGGFTEFDINNNSFYSADTFSVNFPVKVLPDSFKIDALIEADELEIELLIGFPANADSFTLSELVTQIVGQVDDLNYDPVANTISLSGRDYTSKFIDEKTAEKWPNKSASEIATALAVKHGLTPVVVATTERVGNYYEIDHVRVDNARSEWDLLTWLAGQTLDAEGNKYVVYVKGRELHFEPGPKETDVPYKLDIIKPDDNKGYTTFDGKSIKFSRNLTVLKNVVVTVKSWNAKSKQAFSVSYPKGNKTSIKPGDAVAKNQEYSYTIPGLSNEQALQRAQALHHDISKHQVQLSGSGPGDFALHPRRILQVSGTGTKFDQVYFPDNINQHFSVSAGYSMDYTAKNRSPESDPDI